MAYFVKIGTDKYRLFVDVGYNRGERIRKTKTITATSDSKAKKELRNFENELSTKDYTKVVFTFKEFTDKWYNLYVLQQLEPTTAEARKLMLKFISPFFDKMQMDEIKQIHVAEYLANEIKSGRGSLPEKYKVLKSIFSIAVQWDVIKNNPVDGFKPPKPATKQNKGFYTIDEVKILFELIKDLESYQELIVILAVVCGLRRGEILALDYNDFDFTNNKININSSLQVSKDKGKVIKKTKTEDSRDIIVPDYVMDMVRSQFEKNEIIKKEMGNLWKGFTKFDKKINLLICNEYGEPFRPDFVTSFWNRFMYRQDRLKKIRFHDLRHTSASVILSETGNMKIVQKRLGHKNIKTTLNLYAHMSDKDDEKASDVFNGLR